jgi:hypothetical protein
MAVVINNSALHWPINHSSSRTNIEISIDPPLDELCDLFEETELISIWVKKWMNLWPDLTLNSPQGRVPECLLGTGPNAQEFVLLYTNIRPGIRLIMPANTVVACVQYVASLGLLAIPSAFIFKPIPISSQSSYSDNIELLPNDKIYDDDNISVFLYIGQDRMTTWKLWALEILQNEKELGIVLGYPHCCSETYNCLLSKQISEGKVNHRPALINLYAHFFGYQIISHEPCAINCSNSIGLAKIYFETLNNMSPSSTKELLRFLVAPVLDFGGTDFVVLIDAKKVDVSEILFYVSKLLQIGRKSYSFANLLKEFGENIILRFNEQLVIDNGTRLFTVPDAKLILHEISMPSVETSYTNL